MKARSILSIIISGSIFIFLSCFSNATFGSCDVTAQLVNNATCFGSCDGRAVANVTLGVPPYTYQWYDDSGNPLNTKRTLLQLTCAQVTTMF